ncbi:endonuclease III domain-containing protein [Candidatus Poribacteria bacterium]|nr:endonuclease III domain-containing protein [Candidatus Poribacteria bacterium]MYA71251.1 endonuclease III domain-containing protein [Candidatus Poribacteria bacterium]MYH83630.1 endonuclease III domain-containing protein [Candidatus Poribacteria bacterium]MYK92867.1 endonuclease III domain-containing protein [Candidatus Poribacteria bacterium]
MQILCEDNITEKLYSLYNQLLAQHGDRKWWPADTPFEVALGAILTQATSWRNVEKAMENLRNAGAFTAEEIASISQTALEQLIRPSRYFRMKAQKVRAFVDYITERPMHVMFAQDVPQLREELLSIYGVGPETADTIILYAASKPSFVVDSYTYRLFSRLGWIEGKYNYAKLRAMFMDNLPHDVELFNEYHALIVRHGARVCHKRTPSCQECRLRESCEYYNASEQES